MLRRIGPRSAAGGARHGRPGHDHADADPADRRTLRRGARPLRPTTSANSRRSSHRSPSSREEPATAFVVFLLGLVTVIAGMILVAELVIRAALDLHRGGARAARVRGAAVASAPRNRSQAARAPRGADPVEARHRRRPRGVSGSAWSASGRAARSPRCRRPRWSPRTRAVRSLRPVGILLAAMAAFGVSRVLAAAHHQAHAPHRGSSRGLRASRAAQFAAGSKPLSMASYTRIAGGAKRRARSVRRRRQLRQGQPARRIGRGGCRRARRRRSWQAGAARVAGAAVQGRRHRQPRSAAAAYRVERRRHRDGRSPRALPNPKQGGSDDDDR